MKDITGFMDNLGRAMKRAARAKVAREEKEEALKKAVAGIIMGAPDGMSMTKLEKTMVLDPSYQDAVAAVLAAKYEEAEARAEAEYMDKRFEAWRTIEATKRMQQRGG